MASMTINMNTSIKVFCLAPYERRSNSCFNRQTAAIAKTPFENRAKQTIDGVMFRIALEIGLEATVPFNGNHRNRTKFPRWWRLFSSSPTMCQTRAAKSTYKCNGAEQDQSQRMSRAKATKKHDLEMMRCECRMMLKTD